MHSHHRHRSTIRTYSALLAGLAAVALLAGCAGPAKPAGVSTRSSSSSTDGAQSFGLHADSSVTALVPTSLKGKTLNVAIYNDGAPQDFIENGKLVGIQPDFARAVSEVSGVKFNPTGVGSFDSIIPGLQSRRYSAAFVDFGITTERQKVIDLIRQFDLPTGFGVKTGSGLKFGEEKDLCGITLGTLAGSYFIQQVQAISARCVSAGGKAITIQTYPTQSDAVLAVTNGRSQAYAVSTDQLAYAAKQSGGLSVQKFVYAPIPQGIGVPKGDPLGPVIVQAVKVLIENGTYKKILDKWGISSAAIPADKVAINPL